MNLSFLVLSFSSLTTVSILSYSPICPVLPCVHPPTTCSTCSSKFSILIVKHKLHLLPRAKSTSHTFTNTLRHQEHGRVSGCKGTAIRFLCIAFLLDIVGMDAHTVKQITQIFIAGLLPLISRSLSFGLKF